MAYYETDMPQVINTGGGNGNGILGGGDGILAIILFAMIFLWGRNNNGNNQGASSGGGETIGYELGKIATTNDVASGFNNSAVLSGINDLRLGQSGIQQTLCQGFGGVNTAIMQNGYETRSAISDLGYRMQDCCCQTQRAIDGVNYNMAKNTCDLQNTIHMTTRDIIDNQNANYRAIHDELIANKIEAKNERIAELTQMVNKLELASSQQGQNAYLTATIDAKTAELLRRLGRDCPTPAYIVPNPNCCYNPFGFGFNGNNSCGCSNTAIN